MESSEIRTFVEAQVCPWCRRGPFKSLPIHTAKTHGVDRRELRRLAGMTMNESVSSVEFSSRARELAVGRGLGHTPQARRGLQKARSSKREYTDAGRRKISETTSKAMSAKAPDVRSEHARRMAHSRTPEGLRRIAVAASKRPRGDEERAAFAERMQRSDVVEKRRASVEAKLQGHGTVASYKRGCRCDPCRRAKRDYRAKLKESRSG